MKPRYFISWLALFAMLLVCSSLWAQGVSTSSMIGLVTDTKGEPLIGASVIATHVPSGSRYGAITQADGRYTILGMRVGGPYRVTASYVGYQTQTIENIFLNLGTASSANFKLAEESATTQEVTVTAARNAAISLIVQERTQLCQEKQLPHCLPLVVTLRILPVSRRRRTAHHLLGKTTA